MSPYPSWTFTIKKAAVAPKCPASQMSVSHGLGTVRKITAIPTGWIWAEADMNKSLSADGTVIATAQYIGTDVDNYEKITQTVTISCDGHSGGKATCSEKAKCEVCGESYGDIDSTNHAGGTEIRNKQEASCTEKGYSGDTYCKGCGEKLATGHELNATGHSGGKATCSEKAKCEVCGESYGDIDSTNHTGGTEIRNKKQATLNQNGYSGDVYCKGCGALIEKGYVTQPSSTEITRTITNIKNDGDVPGATFAKLSAKMSKVTKNSITLKWNKVSGANGYIIYGNKCGAKNRFVKIATVTGASRTTFTQKKLKKNTYYKYIVSAYKNVNKQQSIIATSKTMHIVTLDGKYVNPSSVKVSKANVSIKKGKTFNLKANTVIPKGKKIKVHKKLCYESSNTSIVTVSSKGMIRGKKKGTCYVYVYAQNGAFKKVKVTVK